eukprot:705066-Rhodomonas_salina.3
MTSGAGIGGDPCRYPGTRLLPGTLYRDTRNGGMRTPAYSVLNSNPSSPAPNLVLSNPTPEVLVRKTLNHNVSDPGPTRIGGSTSTNVPGGHPVAGYWC